MNKQKTHKGLQKRVRVTASKKVVRKKSFKGHLLSHKSGRRCQRLRSNVTMKGRYQGNSLRALAEG